MGCCNTRDDLGTQILMRQFSKRKYGHRIDISSSDGMLNDVINAVHRAEQRKGAPVYFIEVYKIYKALKQFDSNEIGSAALWEVKGTLLELYRND